MDEYLFLIILAGVWLIFASISDLKKREVPNWLSFSLIIFALSYRAFYSIMDWNFNFFLQGVVGFAIFYVLAYLFYYGRLFAGGDAKLLMGLGSILPMSFETIVNLSSLGIFILLLFLAGSVYGLLYSFALVFKCKNFNKQVQKEWKKKKLFFYSSIIMALFLLVFVFALDFLFSGLKALYVLPFIFVLFPLLYVYAKAIEEGCMIKTLNPKELTEGDWLYIDVKIGRKKIKADWQGLTEYEINLLRKDNKKVKIKQGIPFVPAFLFAFILYVLFLNYIYNFFAML